MLRTSTLALVAGLLLANGTPHLVKGIVKEAYPMLAGGGGPIPNLLAGWAMIVGGGVALVAAHVGEHPAAAGIAGAVGFLLMGLVHAGPGAMGTRPTA
jgi:hypothetical protein